MTQAFTKVRIGNTMKIVPVADTNVTPVVLPKNLREMLSVNRGYSSGKTSAMWLQHFIKGVTIIEDKYENMYVHIGSVKDHPYVFTCHLDTVEAAKDILKKKQLKVVGDMVSVEGGAVLGADDTAGIWLMVEMINRKIPGTYVFFQDEESGRLGSEYAIKKAAHIKWDSYKFMLSFDRMNTTDIVNYQMSEKCCSDTFVKGLSNLLGMGHTAADGSYTDSYTFIDVIPECTNLSVGYYAQHSTHECLNVSYLMTLRDKVVSVDWTSLVSMCVRNPKAGEMRYWDKEYSWFTSPSVTLHSDYPKLSKMSPLELEDWVYNNPTEASEVLADLLGVY